MIWLLLHVPSFPAYVGKAVSVNITQDQVVCSTALSNQWFNLKQGCSLLRKLLRSIFQALLKFLQVRLQHERGFVLKRMASNGSVIKACSSLLHHAFVRTFAPPSDCLCMACRWRLRQAERTWSGSAGASRQFCRQPAWHCTNPCPQTSATRAPAIQSLPKLHRAPVHSCRLHLALKAAQLRSRQQKAALSGRRRRLSQQLTMLAVRSWQLEDQRSAHTARGRNSR